MMMRGPSVGSSGDWESTFNEDQGMVTSLSLLCLAMLSGLALSLHTSTAMHFMTGSKTARSVDNGLGTFQTVSQINLFFFFLLISQWFQVLLE